jgi:hypothetical protein
MQRAQDGAPGMATDGRRLSNAVLASRVGHGIVSALFVCCIGVLYAGAWRGTAGPATLAAVAALCLEGVLVVVSHGNCPLAPLFRRLGDDTSFFELFLPPRAATLAVPVLGGVAFIGMVVLSARAS